MKIGIISDLHAGVRNDSVAFNEHFIKFFEQMFFPYLLENNIKHVHILGDVFHNRTSTNSYILNSWKTKVFNVLNENFETYIILGNHDTYYKSTNSINSLKEHLAHYDNIQIIDKPIVFSYGTTNILSVPWLTPSDIESFPDLLDSNAGVDAVFGHFDIVGFQHYKGLYNKDHGFSPSLFKRFKMVLSGHYHFKSSGDNITYVGSPYEMNWADHGCEHGFHVLDTKTYDLEFIENTNHMFYHLKFNKDEKTEITDVLSGSYVKVFFDGENRKEFSSYMAMVRALNPIDVVVIETQRSVDGKVDDVMVKNTGELVKEYVDSLPDTSDDDKIKLNNLFDELYISACEGE